MNAQRNALDAIDDINNHIKNMLEQAKSCLDIYKVISNNATTVNQKRRWGDFWGFMQGRMLDCLILNITKIFEKEKVFGYDQNSISAILAIIEKNKVEPKYSDQIVWFLKKYDKEINHQSLSANKTDDFFEICRKFHNTDKYKIPLSKIKTVRDKMIAHSEAGHKVTSIGSLADIEKIIEFGADFYSTILGAFLGIGAADIMNFDRRKRSLEHLFAQVDSGKLVGMWKQPPSGN